MNSEDRPAATAAAPLEAAKNAGCDHLVTCDNCKDESREFGGAGERILSWSKAIELLVDRLGTAGTDPDDLPVLRDAIDGLAFAIATIANQDIVSETLAPLDREVPLGGRYQPPRILRAS